MAAEPRTLSKGIAARPDTAPHLFVVVNCHDPAASSLRVPLNALSRLDLRRAAAESSRDPHLVAEHGNGTLLVHDGWMSTAHATLRRVLGAWSIEDQQSRNGTFVNGAQVQRAVLRDGDVIETGQTFFVFRESTPAAPEPSPVDRSGPRRALATLLPSLAADFAQLEAVAPTAIPVLVVGETGTGKDLIAASLHALSGRTGPFQPVDCAALHVADLQGRLLHAADRGTLFFDELADLSPAAQSLLLRALQDGQVSPAGAAGPVRVDVRVVSASNHTLEELASGNRVRADLLARLSGFTLRLPPLRERREDLGLLLRTLLADAPAAFSCEAMRAILLYRWPLNVRELEKTIRAALVLSGGNEIGPEHLPATVRAAQQPAPAAVTSGPATKDKSTGLQRFIDEIWRRHVVRVLVAYAVAVFGALQGFDIIVTRLSLPPRWMAWLVMASLVGFPITAVLSWIYDWTRAGIVRTAPLAPEEVPPAAVRRRRVLTLALALLLLAAIAAGGALWWHDRPPS